jgi:DmsE family decaheme c-type cytochrome
MQGGDDCTPAGLSWCGAERFTNCGCLIARISVVISALIYLAWLGLAQPVRAEHPGLTEKGHPYAPGASSAAKFVEPDRHPQLYDHAASSVDLMQIIDAEQPKLASLDNAGSAHPHFEDAELMALHEYARQIGAQPPELAGVGRSKSQHPAIQDMAVAALREYAQQIGIDQPDPANGPRLRIAEADNALDALREFLRGGEKPSSTPDTPTNPTPRATPNPTPRATPNSAPRAAPNPVQRTTPVQSRPTAPAPVRAVGDAHYLGTGTCLICHTNQANSFGKTLMGRIGKTQTAKFDCENCHGPASLHIKAGGCAACHGNEVSRRTGIPTLAGQNPQYLVPTMKAYISGQRKHALMNEILAGVADTDLNNIALFYSRQVPTRAQTPLVGDPTAGKAASALCVWCHGEKGISVGPAFPSLAGQDAQYLASAVKAYKDGSRSKSVPCAGCHGESGISKRPGVPNLAGQDPQFLVRMMKEYIDGDRKHDLMKAMLSGVGDAELNKIALFYARQTPARAQTPLIGDPVAGKAASEACAGCHGEQGVVSSSPDSGAPPEFPNLAGQDSQFLANAIKAYRAGSRTNETMRAMAETVDESAINDVASYLATLSPAQPGLSASQKNAPATTEPVLVKNGILASLDERTANNIVSYFASLQPAQAVSAKGAPAAPQPSLVSKAVLTGGRSLGGIISFRKNDPGRRVEDNNTICLGCHERGGRNYWSGSTHETRGVACTECHTVMQSISRKANLKTETEPETCFQCHKDRRAQMFRSSHMPLREGKIVCSNCHNPHGSATESLLIESSINGNCYKCHAEKRGPFLFEHTPVRENCLNCHDAHGAVNEYLLKVSRPRLCAECHTIDHGPLIAAGPKVVQGFGRACQNCHSRVHGTNSPSGALLQR